MTDPAITPERVRNFLLTRYADQINGRGNPPAEIGDCFDLLLEGIVDSFGILEMVGELEKEYGIELDMSGLVAEEISVLGPLTRFVAAQAAAQGTGERPARLST